MHSFSEMLYTNFVKLALHICTNDASVRFNCLGSFLLPEEIILHY